jgi:thiosulfate reductase cytochrome b subunit
MAESVDIARFAGAGHVRLPPRHTALIRVTHWITALGFFALLLSGVEIVLSHPRFYWGETGNVLTRPLFVIPVPSSRAMVPTGYGFVLPDQNGWSRYLHFQAAWAVVLVGIVYFVAGFWTRHFQHDLVPAPGERTWRACIAVIQAQLRAAPTESPDAFSYNALQRVAYLVVIFVLFPLAIWTGLALSPAFNSALPAFVNLLGGRQSARTLHFFVSVFLLFFVMVHIVMVVRAGYKSRMRAMITGFAPAREEGI